MVTESDLTGFEPSSEDEEDLSLGATEAVLRAADWTVGTLLDQLRQDRINLKPRFQRREAWTDDRKSEFIESLLLNLPIPQLVLAESKGARGSFIVIDGKQRLTTLRRFGVLPGDPSAIEPLELKGLSVRSDLNGQTWHSMSENASLREEIQNLENLTIRTVVVTNWENEDLLHLIFLRLNSNTVPLSSQELRQALHPGPFVEWIDDRSGDSPGLRRITKSRGPDFRMRDAELLLRYLAFTERLDTHRGNLKNLLDRTCDHFNEHWAKEESALEKELATFEEAVSHTYDIFDDGAFNRWDGSRFDRRFNRAIFDIMLYYFRIPEIAQAARAERDTVVEAFKRVCSDSEFLRSVQTTTKTVRAIHYRLSSWGQALANELPVQVPIPELVGTRAVRIQRPG